MDDLGAKIDKWLTTPDDKSVYTCCDCGGEIYEGETAYRLDGEIYCHECMQSWLEAYAFTVGQEV
jgi:hypothetical protein